MPTAFEQVLIQGHKADMIAYLKANPADFKEAIKLALTDRPVYSTHAAWLLWSCIDVDDKRIAQCVFNFIKLHIYRHFLYTLLEKIETSIFSWNRK